MEFSYEVKQEFGKMSDKNGYSKEFNLVSYNGRDPVYDIRNWRTSEDGEKTMAKGITLSKEEVIKLRDMLNALDFGA